ncbi:HAD family hydrolase [Vibrio ziniensis]|uniref:HAD family hydrolase n=1 Tax=Vibrio ziniensis TaxID=2711221 RepID=A0A6G7CMY3_9VIBR|nr:HAD family hydrolase [Vibrio ziniensis]QIH43408.1 HAD family hydrolase [Vibrio ziniensis]
MPLIYLFDWGDTLMVDFADAQGKMCDWLKVEAVEGALETLQTLSQKHDIYIATNAADSCEQDIKSAFQRVKLSPFIKGYFCFENIGLSKKDPAFYSKIVSKLGVSPECVTMVGDSQINDVENALKAGLNAVWFSHSGEKHHTYKTINSLVELIHL